MLSFTATTIIITNATTITAAAAAAAAAATFNTNNNNCTYTTCNEYACNLLHMCPCVCNVYASICTTIVIVQKQKTNKKKKMKYSLLITDLWVNVQRKPCD